MAVPLIESQRMRYEPIIFISFVIVVSSKLSKKLMDGPISISSCTTSTTTGSKKLSKKGIISTNSHT
jgi:hypothetical protein